MALNTFAPAGVALVVLGSGTQSSQTIALPGSGSDSTILVTNTSPSSVAVLLGTSSAVTVTGFGNGVCVPGNSSLALTRGTNTYIAVYGLGGVVQLVNIASGS